MTLLGEDRHDVVRLDHVPKADLLRLRRELARLAPHW